jgi:hypothetical protein
MRPETARRIIRSTVWKLYLTKQPVRDPKKVMQAIEVAYRYYFSREHYFPEPLEHWIDVAREESELPNIYTLSYYSDRIMAPHRLGWYYYHLQNNNFKEIDYEKECT